MIPLPDLSVLGSAALLDAAAPLSFSPQWYRQTLFDTYHEVHALQLGLYAGLLVVGLRSRGYRHTGTVLTLALFAFTMGFPDIYTVCQKAGEACGSLPVQLQPWYFLTGLIGVSVVGPRIGAQLRRAWRLRRTATTRRAGPVARPPDEQPLERSVDAAHPGEPATDGGRRQRALSGGDD